MTTISLEQNSDGFVSAENKEQESVVAPVKRRFPRIISYIIGFGFVIAVIAMMQFTLASKISTYGYEISYVQGQQEELLAEYQKRRVKLAEALTLDAVQKEVNASRKVVANDRVYTDKVLDEPVAFAW